ncbi:hypothetical protein NIES2119_03295 [[Phormidium ambiguum] IAM M-71]|uniref:Uncharacterized protein n=1 Tax=[Phormidium ambiguum] IAM M-71 TaxID=454136 RepID=A0A1U7IRK0_9CYAN|nr:hypothetical protein [Phormidium ambiguum]OKH39989.1 hypothetical protein NIES2119_03295 [Phormidium ambiguum IAM M-71]
MNRTFYNILGFLSVIAAISLLLQMREILTTRPPENLSLFYSGTALLVGVCIVIAIFCFFPKTHPYTLRIIGAIGLISTIYYLYDAFRTQNFFQVGTALLFWLPGSIYLIVKGKMTDV